MVLLCFLFLLAFVVAKQQKQSFLVSENGQISIKLGGHSYNLDHSSHFFRVNKKQYFLNDLQLESISTSFEGSDNMGKYIQQNIEWLESESSSRFQTNVKQYSTKNSDETIYVFQQVYLSDTTSTKSASQDDIIASFPSFSLSPKNDFFKDKAWTTYINNMACAGGQLFCTPISSLKEVQNVPSGQAGGVPFIIFGQDMKDTLIISPLNNFMSTNAYFNNVTNVMSFGVQGLVDSIDADFTVESIFYVHKGGVVDAMEGWGKVMQNKYSATSKHPSNDDVTNNYLSYWTDNGGYYYYLTEQGLTYEQTLINVFKNAAELKLPYKSLQLDSWWYYRGKDNGVVTWDAKPEIFENGLDVLQSEINLPITAHNRWWSVDTSYAKQNGGDYEFIVERLKKSSVESSNLRGSATIQRQLNDVLPYGAAMPLEQRFWDDLFAKSKAWGLYTYEQDWLHNEFLGLEAALTSATQARKWLLQMGDAASKYGLKIQYCMAFPRFFLQTLEVQAVTQIRSSDDYGHGARNDQWSIGDTSLLAFSLNLKPFKDTFWSSKIQPGNPYLNGTGQEPRPHLQAVISTLSTGPVGISDKIGYSDASLIMRSCNTEGLLLKPSRPLTNIDVVYAQRAFGNAANGPIGDVQSTYSVLINGEKKSSWDIVLGVALNETFSVTPEMLPSHSKLKKNSARYAYQYQGDAGFNNLQKFKGNNPISLSACDREDFQLWFVAPELDNGFVLLGETMKWVPISSQRIMEISSSNNGSPHLAVSLSGGENEKVELSIAHKSNLSVIFTTSCVINDLQSIKVIFSLDENKKITSECVAISR